jgi:hypothetical protein
MQRIQRPNTNAVRAALMSAECLLVLQFRKYGCVAANGRNGPKGDLSRCSKMPPRRHTNLLNHLVGEREQRGWYC